MALRGEPLADLRGRVLGARRQQAGGRGQQAAARGPQTRAMVRRKELYGEKSRGRCFKIGKRTVRRAMARTKEKP